MITIVLVFGLSRTGLSLLRWDDFDPTSLTLRQRRRHLPLPITEHLARQLLSIPQRSSRIFLHPGERSLVLDSLMADALAVANLGECTWSDLVDWSKAQSASTRTAIATV